MHVKTAPAVWTCNTPELRCHRVFIRLGSPAEHVKDTPQSLPAALELTREAVINAHTLSWLNRNDTRHKPSAFFASSLIQVIISVIKDDSYWIPLVSNVALVTWVELESVCFCLRQTCLINLSHFCLMTDQRLVRTHLSHADWLILVRWCRLLEDKTQACDPLTSLPFVDLAAQHPTLAKLAHSDILQKSCRNAGVAVIVCLRWREMRATVCRPLTKCSPHISGSDGSSDAEAMTWEKASLGELGSNHSPAAQQRSIRVGGRTFTHPTLWQELLQST